MKLKEDTFLQGGKYKIVRHIASGGFGNTYEALDASMGNARVAIKEFFVKDCCARDSVTQNVTLAVEGKRDLVAKLKKKFLAEAEAIRNMKHDNIVRVYSSFEENDTAYYVMEYIDGLSLEQYGKLDEATALKYIRQIADALSYVHNQKCLHLDIKPANILINKDDKAILIDFGSSKYYDDGKAVTTTTMPGLYTPGYAPYEQTVGGITGFTPASDIYALGATLYRLLSGTTPPPSGRLLELDEDVELPTLPYSISESTRKAVEMAMIPQKKTRTQTVDDFLRCLDGGINTIYGPTTGDNGGYTTIVGGPIGGNGGTPPPPPPTESNPFWKILLGVAAVIVLFCVGLNIYNKRQEPQIFYPPQDSIVSDSVDIIEDTVPEKIIPPEQYEQFVSTDMNVFFIHGRVKSFTEDGYTYCFNKEGKLLRILDSSGIELVNDYPGGEMVHHENGKLKWISYASFDRHDFYYDSQNLLSQRISHDDVDASTTYIFSDFDSRKLPTTMEVTTYGGDEDLEGNDQYTVSLSYSDFDEFGNWRQQKWVSKEGTSYITRSSIIYYSREDIGL